MQPQLTNECDQAMSPVATNDALLLTENRRQDVHPASIIFYA